MWDFTASALGGRISDTARIASRYDFPISKFANVSACAFILPNPNLFSKWQFRQEQHRQMMATLHASDNVKCNHTLREEFRHAVASTTAKLTEHLQVLVSSRFRSRSVVPPSPFPASMLFCLWRFLNFFWNGAGKARAGFSFKGETDGIHCCAI